MQVERIMVLGYHLSFFNRQRTILLLYLFEDIFSRKVVGYEVYEQECGECGECGKRGKRGECGKRGERAGNLLQVTLAVPEYAVGLSIRQWCADESANNEG
jgi:hypothetical protein